MYITRIYLFTRDRERGKRGKIWIEFILAGNKKISRYSRLNRLSFVQVHYYSLFFFTYIYMYITSLIKFYFVLQEKKRNETKVSLGIRLIKRKYKNSYVWLCFRNLEIKISSTKERQWNPTNNTLYINLYIIEIRRKFVFQFSTLFAVSISFTLHATIPSKAQERDLKFYVRLKKQ